MPHQVGLQIPVRPGKAGPKGMGECDGPMKFGSSSGGCETRPARVQPHQAGSEPCAERRCVGTRVRGPWLVQPRNAYISGAQGVDMPEGHGVASAMGEGARTPDGVVDHGTRKEDGPETWETQVSLRAHPRSCGDRVTNLRRRVRPWVHVPAAKNKCPSRSRPGARDDRSVRTTEARESEGPI